MRNEKADLVLPNGASLNFKVRHDASGAAVVSELQIFFAQGSQIPLGGISSATLRQIHIGDLLRLSSELGRDIGHSDELSLTVSQESGLLHALSNYPARVGRIPTPDIFPASMAYFYSRILREHPRNPNVKLAELLEVPIRTVNARVAKAKELGFLTVGESSRVGGRGRGILSPSAKREILRHLEGLEIGD